MVDDDERPSAELSFDRRALCRTSTTLIELTCGDLEARQADGTDNAKALVTKYKQRITALNEAGPKLRAVIAVNSRTARGYLSLPRAQRSVWRSQL